MHTERSAMKKLLLVNAALCALSIASPASAADMPVNAIKAPLPPPGPYETPKLLATCANRTMSTSLNNPART